MTDYEVLDYFDYDRIVEVAGHSTREVAVKHGSEDRSSVAFECRDCDLVSNNVTAFDQHECDQ